MTRKMVRVPVYAVVALMAAGCGQQVYRSGEGVVEVTGVIQVVGSGSGNEGVVLEEELSGEIYGLVGDPADELIDKYGQRFLVRGTVVAADDARSAWFPMPGLHLIEVSDYALLGAPEPVDDTD
ncbi:hypothetical protein JW921_08980 [Candidatus Fermentibacterales bacterium]|nr:hypothetical protein [Candidatus Fermentibacterales bacterium]